MSYRLCVPWLKSDALIVDDATRKVRDTMDMCAIYRRIIEISSIMERRSKLNQLLR